jgi:hypothetical protein
MTLSRSRTPYRAAPVILAALLLTACATQGPGPQTPAAPEAPTILPSSIPARDIIGRWGFASYHKEGDRGRTEAAARGQCNQPYVIAQGANGGVIMHLADQSQPVELRLKGGPGGKNYIGPADEAGGSARDREIVSLDGRVMILRWIDPEVAGRYGVGVYVRCGPKA